MKSKLIPFHDLNKMPFGEHRGKILRDVPASYLLNLETDHGAELAEYPALVLYLDRARKVLINEAKLEEASDEDEE